MSSLEDNIDQSPKLLDLVAKIEKLQQELQVKQRRLKIADIQLPLYPDTCGVAFAMRSLSEEIEALEEGIEALQQKLEKIKTEHDLDAA